MNKRPNFYEFTHDEVKDMPAGPLLDWLCLQVMGHYDRKKEDCFQRCHLDMVGEYKGSSAHWMLDAELPTIYQGWEVSRDAGSALNAFKWMAFIIPRHDKPAFRSFWLERGRYKNVNHWRVCETYCYVGYGEDIKILAEGETVELAIARSVVIAGLMQIDALLFDNGQSDET